ncbi:MAG: DNA helicase RecQ [Sphingobacteriales bacterium]|nr:MAG: DNA helicase RecQ [Sphingobacteriales bacterium]
MDNHNLEENLKQHFGFDKFKGEQQKIIQSILDKVDTLVIMPTGGGKSLCYQLPAILSEGTAIVVSPLIALMKNQVDLIRGYSNVDNIAHFLNSQLNKAQIATVKKDITSGITKLLYVAPESLIKQENIDFLKTIPISFVAVDEAHCISEWGHDFRPEYRKIRQMLNEIEQNIPIIALTATATPKVQSDIVKTLGLVNHRVFISSFLRENLYYEIKPKPSKQEALKDIIKYIKKQGTNSGIVYCLSRNTTEEIAEILVVNGINATAYHAGLDANTRTERQDNFLREEVQVIVATIAFGMGIDKPDVRFVIHFDVPKSLENYYQETGRAGRDGLQGECITYFSPKEIHKFEKYILSNKEKSVTEKEIAVQQLNEVETFAQSAECRKKVVLHYFGEEINNCGMCDNCLKPKTPIEIKDDVLLALQALEQTNEQTNALNLVNILVGRKSAEITTKNLDKIKVFGKGSEKDMIFWSSVVNKIILENLVRKEIEAIGVLKFTEKRKKFLKKPENIKGVINHKFEESEDDEDIVTLTQKNNNVLEPKLLDILKDVRRKIAKQHKVPTDIVFQEASLIDMATFFPITTEELSHIYGVSKGKAERYGKDFLKAIELYVEENNIERFSDFSTIKSADKNSNTKINIIKAIDKRMPLEHIASSFNMSLDNLVAELETIVNSGTKVNIDYYLNDKIDEDIIEEIFDYFKSADTTDLKLAHKVLKEDDIEFEEIQLVRIKFISDVAN